MREELDYFMLMYMPNISLTTLATNVVLVKKNQKQTNDEEMLTVHMITLLRSVFDFGPPSSWWPSARSEAKQDADDLTAFMIHRPNLLKLCGMSLSRYNKLMGACTPCTDDGTQCKMFTAASRGAPRLRQQPPKEWKIPTSLLRVRPPLLVLLRRV
jgi:hypothetical protein